MPGNTNFLDVDISPLGYPGIGIRGKDSSEALARILGYWPMSFLAEKQKAVIVSQDRVIFKLESLTNEYAALAESFRLLGEEKAKALQAQRKTDRAFFFGYGAGTIVLSVVGALVGGSNVEGRIVGVLVGAGLGIGASLVLEIGRSKNTAKLLGIVTALEKR